MSKDDLVYVGHMLDTARRVRDKTRNVTRAQYDQDENLRLALTHLTQPTRADRFRKWALTTADFAIINLLINARRSW